MTEPLKISKRDAHERRSTSGAEAGVLAADAGLPTEPYKTASRCRHGPGSSPVTALLQ